MEKSNLIITIIIVLCIAAAVAAYGIINNQNAVFSDLASMNSGSGNGGNGIGNNTTNGTKFIVDVSRDRVVYCAGLNSLSRFSYMTILFSNLEKATLEKSKDGYFVRIYTKDKDILDVSCKKTSVAQYIMAQITTIVNL